MHLAAFERMNIRVQVTGDRIFCSTDHMAGSGHRLRYPSVGATENIILASVLAPGQTVIKNAAKEPEVIELCLLLNKMGADIHGMGTGNITIYGVSTLHDAVFSLVSDRIVAATYLANRYTYR